VYFVLPSYFQDFNDAAPMFTRSVYNGTITENHRIGTPTGVVLLANDAEPDHMITYFTESGDPSSAFFSVERTTGVLSLAQAVDYDPPAMHRLFTFRVCLHITEL
jgi:hypothetical protein